MPTTTTVCKPARELQNRLVQCCLDYIQETHNQEIQRVVFTVDMLQESAKYGFWQICSDSTCELEGLDNKNGFYKIDFSA